MSGESFQYSHPHLHMKSDLLRKDNLWLRKASKLVHRIILKYRAAKSAAKSRQFSHQFSHGGSHCGQKQKSMVLRKAKIVDGTFRGHCLGHLFAALQVATPKHCKTVIFHETLLKNPTRGTKMTSTKCSLWHRTRTKLGQLMSRFVSSRRHC